MTCEVRSLEVCDSGKSISQRFFKTFSLNGGLFFQAVHTNRAQCFADVHNMPLFETSAKDDTRADHVESIFLTLAHKLKSARPMMVRSVFLLSSCTDLKEVLGWVLLVLDPHIQ